MSLTIDYGNSLAYKFEGCDEKYSHLKRCLKISDKKI